MLDTKTIVSEGRLRSAVESKYNYNYRSEK